MSVGDLENCVINPFHFGIAGNKFNSLWLSVSPVAFWIHLKVKRGGDSLTQLVEFDGFADVVLGPGLNGLNNTSGIPGSLKGQ